MRDGLLGLCLALALFAAIVSALHTRELDIAVYRQAAERVFVAGVDPYPRREGDVLPFTYPPTALFLMYPFSRLDLADAERLVWHLNLALVPILMLLLVRDLAKDAPGRRLALWGPIYIAAFGGVYLTLVFHQINLLILLCLWLYWRSLRRGQGGYGAGAALALGAVAKPHYALLLLGALARPRPRLLVGGAVAGLALLTLSLVLAPAGSWGSWLNQIVGATSYTTLPPGHSSIAAPWNRSIPGLIARFLVPNKFTEPLAASPATAALLSTTLVLTLAGISAWVIMGSMRRRRHAPSGGDGTRIDLELSILSVWIFLAAPASWTHHLVMLLPAALVLLRDAVLDPAQPPTSRATAGLVLLVLALTLDDLIPPELRTSSQALMSLMTIAVLALWLLLVERLHRRV
jgi:alpha-1,2-mannosyltransferase